MAKITKCYVFGIMAAIPKRKKSFNEMRRKNYIIITLLLLLSCGLYVIYIHNKELKEEEEASELQQEYVVESEQEETSEELVWESTEAAETIEKEELIYCERIIDFIALHEENPDIYAWIKIPGTEIDYPVLQSEEDNYYLNRNVDYIEGYPGCIYTNKCNVKDFSDYLTILYGHNMKNGTMFAGLHKFEEEDFFENNDQIVIYTENNKYTYQVYAAVAYGDSYLPSVFEVEQSGSQIQFDRSIKEYEDGRKLLREGVDITQEDRLLILSTCIAKEGTKRYLVVGKLVETAVYYE